MQNSYVLKKNNNVKPYNEISLFNLPHQKYYNKQQFPKVNLNTLDEQQQLLLQKYLLNAKELSTKQLIKERDYLLKQLHHINQHLNQIIPNLSPNIKQLSPSQNTSQYNKSKESPHQKSQLYQPLNSKTQLYQSRHLKNHLSNHQNNKRTESPNQSNVNKKNSKLQIQSTPLNIKTYSKDELQNLNLNEIDSLSENNLKLLISLEQEIQDYQFMLTPQYSQKLNNQIQNDRQVKKQLLQQILSFNKIIDKQNKNYDQQVISQLEKYSYDKQMELNLLTKKLNSKLSKLESIESQNKQKLKKIDGLSKQQSQLCHILQMYQDEDYQGPQQSRKKDDKYSKLCNKKEKIEKMINSMNSNKLKEYNKKLSDFRLLQHQIQQYDKLTKETDNNILTLLHQKQNFHQQYKHIINKAKIIPNFQTHYSKSISMQHSKSSPIGHLIRTEQQRPNQKAKQHPIPQKKQHSFQKTGSLFNQNQLNYFNQHQYQKNQPIGQINSMNCSLHQNKNQSFQTQQKTQLSQPQHVKRRRIYTQLENNHYFTSLERNHHKQKTPQLKDSKKNISMKFVHNQAPLNRKQRKLNSSASANVKVEGLTKVKIFNTKKRQNEESEEKDMSDENMIEVEERIRNLQQFLGKEEITLGALKKMENRLSLQNSNRKLKLRFQGINAKEKNQKNKSFDETYQLEPFQEPSQRKESKININQRHYKELCQRLGKNKLLIEEDADIRRLIYHGISGSARKND